MISQSTEVRFNTSGSLAKAFSGNRERAALNQVHTTLLTGMEVRPAKFEKVFMQAKVLRRSLVVRI
jgi:hypothetical protein